MSTIIAIETSIPEASISLTIDGELFAVKEFESHRKQNKLLFPAIESIISELKTRGRTPDQIIVGTGPGSYSGSRISIAAAHGLAIAYQCPVSGLGSFLATQTVCELGSSIVIGDARRGSFFIAPIDLSSAKFTPVLMDEDAFLETLNGMDSHTPKISFETELPYKDFIQEKPHASLLIQAWNNLPEDERVRLNSSPPQPLYLRAPFITKAKTGHPLLRKK